MTFWNKGTIQPETKIFRIRSPLASAREPILESSDSKSESISFPVALHMPGW